jgi:serine kinase of HPr protein (carbohydrate metabolism regulator)
VTSTAGATVHASAVALAQAGILIRGASGSGKSSLALALLTAHPTRARLIGDDRIALAARGGRLVATVPSQIAGLLEIRGQGIRAFSPLSPAVIRLVVDLCAADEAPRMPSESDETADVEGVRLPRLLLPRGAVDGHVRVAAAAARVA